MGLNRQLAIGLWSFSSTPLDSPQTQMSMNRAIFTPKYATGCSPFFSIMWERICWNLWDKAVAKMINSTTWTSAASFFTNACGWFLNTLLSTRPADCVLVPPQHKMYCKKFSSFSMSGYFTSFMGGKFGCYTRRYCTGNWYIHWIMFCSRMHVEGDIMNYLYHRLIVHHEL